MANKTKVNGRSSPKSNKSSEKDALAFLEEYLASEDEEGFTTVESLEFQDTGFGESESCGGCTLGDGQDCSPPTHYIDLYEVLCSKKDVDGKLKYRRSTVSLGWSEGGCSNSYGDYDRIRHTSYTNP
jgi:hypothetical protein